VETDDGVSEAVLWTPLTGEVESLVAIGSGVPTGDGRAIVVVAEDDSDGVADLPSIMETLEKSSARPSAPTTAETRTAGAGAPVPGSFQKLGLERPECDRSCTCPFGLGLLVLPVLVFDF
jgi:hypothetical protein